MSVLLILALMVGCGSSPEPSSQPVVEPSVQPEIVETERVMAPNVVFIVMDTVRSDHTSLCGYERLTSPNLSALKASGAVVVCDAYAPAPWTVPSHASFFTGVNVLDHNTLRKGAKLDDSYETLAEIFGARDYQTLALAGNITVGHKTGLLQGFEKTEVASSLVGEYRGKGLGAKLDEMLTAADPKRPMFLFVNVMDAHEPYPAIPDHVDWLPAQPMLHHRATSKNPKTRFRRFVTEQMTPTEASEYVQQNTDGYDYGVFHADKNVAAVLDLLKTHGRLDNYRLVVTSDHGEFLGEHQLLGHSSAVWEPVVRVPFLYFDSANDQQITLPQPLAAQTAFHLLRDGKLPEKTLMPTAHSYKATGDHQQKPSYNMVSIWADHEKASWLDGKYEQVDLSADPLEMKPAALAGDHALRPPLEALVKAHEAESDEDFEEDAEVMELLKAMGYVGE